MKLSKLQLISFRNYANFEFQFNNEKPITLITGENGKGKTNILEAIYLLSIGKTFRGAHQEDLIKWGMDYFTVKGELDLGGETTNLDVSFSTYPRKIKSFRINEVKTPHADYLGTFITVLFHPKDLNMLYLEPSLRRKYLNLILSQTDKYYLEALTNYTKVLKQRNALLEEIGNGSHSQAELDVWDERLVEEGKILIEKRQELINFFNSHIQALYRKISGGKESLTIEYNSSASPAGHLTGDYLKRLRLKRDKDIRYGTTTIGPHRDDIKFLLSGRSIEEFASRG
ncbi:MAG: DNA replication and repair protein RecF, partial [Candidatus Gracilibacteria bacterium]